MTIGLLLAAAPAGATTVFTHNFLGSFDGDRLEGAGQRLDAGRSPSGRSEINQSTGNVFVWDLGIGTIDKFDCQRKPAGLFSTHGPASTASNAPYRAVCRSPATATLTVDSSGRPAMGGSTSSRGAGGTPSPPTAPT